MTTHSPSTIALAPESAKIYLLEKNPSKLEELSKDQAITKLSVGVPTLSVRIENRRIVFVESFYDAENLEKIFNKIKEKIKSSYSLSFFPSDITGEGNCDKVKDLIIKLDEVSSVYGLIDYDNTNQSEGHLIVLGQGKRYAIENYILDPILLGAYLVAERIISKESAGLDPTETHLSIANLNKDRLQSFCNCIIRELTYKDENKRNERNFVESYYENGHSIMIPEWYCKTRGHDIEEFVYKIFPNLNQVCRQGKNNLCRSILDKILDDMPELICVDVTRTMQSLVS